MGSWQQVGSCRPTGMRHFDNRQGVYLHKPSNKHLAQGYAAFIRYGPRHVYLRALCEVEVDPAGSVKKGKKTNQLIFGYDFVRIWAFHLQVATKSELKLGDYLREFHYPQRSRLLRQWGSIWVDLVGLIRAQFARVVCGVRFFGPDRAEGGPLPSSTSVIQGGVTPHGAQGGDTPPESSSSKAAAEASEVAQDEISPWLGEPGSLGKYRSDTQDPTFQFSVNVSKALAACLRHGHQPTVSATIAGWVLLEDLLRWPRIYKQHTTPGDLQEIARNNARSRYEMGLPTSGFVAGVLGSKRPKAKMYDLLPVSWAPSGVRML